MTAPLALIRRFLADRRGANAVEFSLVAGPLLLLLFGTVEFGRLFWTSHAIHQVAMATARCVALPQQECQGSAGLDLTVARGFAETAARNWLVPLGFNAVVIDADTTCRSIGLDGFVQVDISHDFDSVVPGLVTAFVGGTALSASACFPRQI